MSKYIVSISSSFYNIEVHKMEINHRTESKVLNGINSERNKNVIFICGGLHLMHIYMYICKLATCGLSLKI